MIKSQPTNMQPKSSTGSQSGTKIENDISTAVLALSKGEIVSFGDVAAKAGHPKAARAAGAVLAKSGDALPWWRVVYADGQVPPCNPSLQVERLLAEGVQIRGFRVLSSPVGRFKRPDRIEVS